MYRQVYAQLGFECIDFITGIIKYISNINHNINMIQNGHTKF